MSMNLNEFTPFNIVSNNKDNNTSNLSQSIDFNERVTSNNINMNISPSKLTNSINKLTNN